ncbi:MAG: UDP-N-acetylmuramoyl-L-alanyl-D-glutamate--2,6-diaminopimelate ligase [Rickettsiales bacterium]|jgi:UDP-N-acetylmuramoyl-L-alanyl-D-glutamate--2,6-diaminopimelate ligase|nr:UDP-N-acetylmuramoyl-L-alanyl-D-glutamate--2,6-diaminopimelate ligase [Rickettsiales bacterium]
MKINNVEITGITKDSRAVSSGWAFFAMSGKYDGSINYITMALEKGASLIIADEKEELPVDVPAGRLFRVPNIRRFLIETAVKFFEPLPENIIAVTGTNGKTSTIHFCRYILEKLGKNAASIGTMGLIHKGVQADIGMAGNTSPDPVLLCDILHKLKAQDCDYVAMEATSIGLDQERMNALPIKVAGFTSLSRDHLEYHGDMDNYFAAKKKLFSDVLAADGAAVLNADDESFKNLLGINKNRKIISYGRAGEQIKLISAEYEEERQKITAGIFGKVYEFSLDAAGEFQTMNALCAIGMVMGLGFAPDDIVGAIRHAPAPAGRLQYVGSPVSGGGVYVDFAHTPGALRSMLESSRRFCRGRLMVLSGTGAPRDPGKRPIMGAVMQELADVVYITDGFYRTYDPAPIRAQIAEGCPKGIEVPGRRNAIARAIRDMRDNDVLILAGMADEQWMYIGTGRYRFSDIEEAKKAMDLRACFPGMDLPL